MEGNLSREECSLERYPTKRVEKSSLTLYINESTTTRKTEQSGSSETKRKIQKTTKVDIDQNLKMTIKTTSTTIKAMINPVLPVFLAFLAN